MRRGHHAMMDTVGRVLEAVGASFGFHGRSEDMAKSTGRRRARLLWERKTLEGGEGVFISGRCPMGRRQIELDEDCGMILLCAFGGNRLQNRAGKIANGMSELENSLAGRA